MRQSEGGEKWSVGPIFPSPHLVRIILWCRFCDSLPERGRVTLSVQSRSWFSRLLGRKLRIPGGLEGRGVQQSLQFIGGHDHCNTTILLQCSRQSGSHCELEIRVLMVKSTDDAEKLIVCSHHHVAVP